MPGGVIELQMCTEAKSKGCFMFWVLPEDFDLHRKTSVQHKNLNETPPQSTALAYGRG